MLTIQSRPTKTRPRPPPPPLLVVVEGGCGEEQTVRPMRKEGLSLLLSRPSSPYSLTHFARFFLLSVAVAALAPCRLRRPRLPRWLAAATAGSKQAAAEEAAFSWPLPLMGIGRKEGRKAVAMKQGRKRRRRGGEGRREGGRRTGGGEGRLRRHVLHQLTNPLTNGQAVGRRREGGREGPTDEGWRAEEKRITKEMEEGWNEGGPRAVVCPRSAVAAAAALKRNDWGPFILSLPSPRDPLPSLSLSLSVPSSSLPLRRTFITMGWAR